MKILFFVLLFAANNCVAQQFQAEVMAGVAGYKGDLTPNAVPLQTVGPSFGVNLKYLMPNNFVTFRGGISYGKISGDDNYKSTNLNRSRNLNFKTDIVEAHVGVELNIIDPAYYVAYPYVFAGVGAFKFNPYSYDQYGYKIYLRPLGTEGQGLEQYPDRDMYSLVQLCLPVGGGFKWAIGDKYEVIFELGARYLLTDHLDDVSTTFVNLQALEARRGPLASELSYRGPNPPVGRPLDGRQRGNPKSKDWYYMAGLKLNFKLGGSNSPY